MKEIDVDAGGPMTKLGVAENLIRSTLRADVVAPFFPLVTLLRQQMECAATEGWHLTRVALRRLVERGEVAELPGGYCLRGPKFD